MGTYGSRSLSVGGTAIVKAVDKIVAKGKKIAGHLLEAADTDIEFENGEFKVKGTDKKVPFGQVALTAYVPHNYPLDKLEPGLNENAFYDPTNFTYPAGSYVCEVEVDKDTGKTTVESFMAVDDFGNMVNPMIVEGQVHGGLAQGLGQAMLEGCVYDPDSGQLLTGSYMDYAMPRADDLPSSRSTPLTPCTHNPLGVKGCGEAGAIGSPAAFMNALTDALGVKDLAMPARRSGRRSGVIRQAAASEDLSAEPSRATTEARSRSPDRVARRVPNETCMYAFIPAPQSVADAAKLGSSDNRYLAGGQSLIQSMRLRLASAEQLVDLGGIKELRGITVDGNGVTIGAMTTHAAVAGSAEVKKAIPGLAELAAHIGDPMVRNMGTIGGSIANSDPAACYPAAVLALGATIRTTRRTIAADDYFKGLFETALDDGELITAVTFPVPSRPPT